MNAQAILQRIEEDAKRSAEQLQQDAQKKADALRKASAEKAAATHVQLMKRVESESAALRDRMGRMAQLESRKKLLEKKRQVMEEAFSEARKALCAQPREKTRAFMLESLKKAAQGDESLLVGGHGDGWFDERFLGELNQQLHGKLTLAEGRREDVTGAVLLRGGTEVYVTYESLLETKRTELETEIARLLFTE